MDIDITVRRIKTGKHNVMAFEVPDQARVMLLELFRRHEVVRLKLSPPFRRRSTGKNSQGHRINGFIQQIAVSTGIPFQGLKEYMKAEAIGEGYPFVLLPTGAVIGKSEADISVEEASILIGTIERIAAEWSIRLQE